MPLRNGLTMTAKNFLSNQKHRDADNENISITKNLNTIGTL